MNDYAKAHFPTKQSPTREDARLQAPYVNQERPAGLEKAAGEGAQTPDAVALLNQGKGFPKSARLRNSAEFRRVYASGRRYDGRYMTAFVLTNSSDSQRLGITASRKMDTRAVLRNRAKRLLREAFRLSGAELGDLGKSYDWVLNARRSLLEVQLAEPLREFREIVARVMKDERDSAFSSGLGSDEDGGSGSSKIL